MPASARRNERRTEQREWNPMINGYSTQQIRNAEAPYLAAGVPLMARAAQGLAHEISRLLPERPGGRVLLLVGSGNNGGDTLYAGAELARGGADVAAVTTGTRIHQAALATAVAAGVHRESSSATVALARSADVIVDGILGIGAGADPALRGEAREVVAQILPVLAAPLRPKVVAVDVPSGINPDDGSVPAPDGPGDPIVLPADVTVTFGGCKAGLLIAPASGFAGRIVLVDVGLKAELDLVKPVLRAEESGAGD